MVDFYRAGDLEFKFKGKRHYLQSSDLYLIVESVAKRRFGAACWVSALNFRDLLKTKCEIFFFENNDLPVDECPALFTVRLPDSSISGAILPTTEPVVDRVEFDESPVAQSATIAEKEIIQKFRVGYTAIEELVSLTKCLHNSILPPKNGRWVFSGIGLDCPFSADPDACFNVSLVQSLANRLTVSEIQHGGRYLGTIKFIVMNT